MGKRIQIRIDEPNKLVRLLATRVAGLSKANADKLVKSGEVKVNGARVRTNAELCCGDTVTAFVPDRLVDATSAKIVYEDANIVIFDKPTHTVYDVLPELYGAPLYAVHRLDANTAGLIVFAKTTEAKIELERAFEERNVKKKYAAAVFPAPKEDKAVLRAFVKSEEGISIVSATPKNGYKTMITEYAVKERIGDAAVLDVFPHTGRMHQIRAHLKFIGSPIIGDPKYGGLKAVGAPDGQMLAAVGIEFSGLNGALEYLNGKEFEIECKFDTAFLRKPI